MGVRQPHVGPCRCTVNSPSPRTEWLTDRHDWKKYFCHSVGRRQRFVLTEDGVPSGCVRGDTEWMGVISCNYNQCVIQINQLQGSLHRSIQSDRLLQSLRCRVVVVTVVDSGTCNHKRQLISNFCEQIDTEFGIEGKRYHLPRTRLHWSPMSGKTIFYKRLLITNHCSTTLVKDVWRWLKFHRLPPFFPAGKGLAPMVS